MPTTDRLILVDFDAAHIDSLYEIQGNQAYMKFTQSAESKERCAESLGRYAEAKSSNGFAPWTALHPTTQKVIGWGGLCVDPDAPEWGPEVIYFIHPDFQGAGLATELVCASLSYGFNECKLSKISSFAMPENASSIRVLQKSSFTFLRYEPSLERNHYVAYWKQT